MRNYPKRKLAVLLVMLFTLPLSIGFAQSYDLVAQAGGTGFDNATTLAVDQAGNLIFGGRFQDTATFDGTSFTATGLANYGISDAYVAKYDTNGNLIWAGTLPP